MEPSREKKLFAAALLLLAMASVMGSAQAGECFSPSKTFRGPCFSSDRCADKCMQEGSGYSGGKCQGIYLRCECITPCKTAATAPAA